MDFCGGLGGLLFLSATSSVGFSGASFGLKLCAARDFLNISTLSTGMANEKLGFSSGASDFFTLPKVKILAGDLTSGVLFSSRVRSTTVESIVSFTTSLFSENGSCFTLPFSPPLFPSEFGEESCGVL
uniref:(northern house mosquito) hypothetical protein n=1 Tax=Culex pipiens TaxID=7175 RepID=A0A8D8JGY3_CULPI